MAAKYDHLEALRSFWSNPAGRCDEAVAELGYTDDLGNLAFPMTMTIVRMTSRKPWQPFSRTL